ncbi:hypothetical protein [Rhizobium sp. TRM95796]|uniref:hypothetical protein n=1 Tax=Rhizobium sp. TRM95796 TaxID=2979862 RepID=UPI0021E9AD19|nr:hypothetical protein [Rhizobium sp. TRM95796]MCV3764956.1 hypothetical protein [Rhizobium sp. TRM95796]
MGFRICWIALESEDRQRCLQTFGMVETGRSDEELELPFSLATLPTGWTILFSNDESNPSEAQAGVYSRAARVIRCQVNENEMTSAVTCYAEGELLWSLTHNSELGFYHIAPAGAAPSFVHEIIARLTAEQDANGGEKSDVDFLFEAPIELAAELTGFRHDESEFDWGEANFVEVRPIGKKADLGKKSLWRRIFSRDHVG